MEKQESDDPRTAEEYYLRGLQAMPNDPQAAIAAYTEALRLDPKYVKAYCARAEARARQGNLSGAIEDHTEAIRLDATCLWPRTSESCPKCGEALLEPVETCPAPVAAEAAWWCPRCGAQFRDGTPFETLGRREDAGFLIVKTYQALYREYAPRYHLTRDWYAIPRIDRTPDQQPIHYRGLDRDALRPLPPEQERGLAREHRDYPLAQVRLAELEAAGRCIADFILDLHEAENVYWWLGDAEAQYEIIWARWAESASTPPEGFRSVGYEPTDFLAHPHVSASCDCMLFPRWHGTDEAGELFQAHFQRLNRFGLFDTASEARDFLRYYLTFDWAEHDLCYITAEVFIRAVEHSGD